MSRLPDRPGPSGLSPARPALRAVARGAVRPCAFHLFPGRIRHRCGRLCAIAADIDARVRPSQARLCLPAPSSLDPPGPAPASLFFAPRAPARWDQSGWLASACRSIGPGGVGTGTPLDTALDTLKPLKCFILRHGSHRSQCGRAHVMRSRTRAHPLFFLSLGTWEHKSIFLISEEVGPFPRSFPALAPLGTWERSAALRLSPDRLCAATSNKIEGGYWARRREGRIWGGSRGRLGESFGRGARGLGAIAAGGDVDQGEIRGLEDLRDQAGAREGGNGGFPPFSGRAIGHVGRLDVGRVAKSGQDQPLSGAEQKLCRLTGLRLGRAIGAGLAELGRDRAEAPGTPPSPAPSRACTPARDAFGIWIDIVQPNGLFSDRNGSDAIGEGASFWARQWGPGGFSRGNSGRAGGAAPRHGHIGKRAGDDVPSGSTRPPGGEGSRLGAAAAHVNSGWGAVE